MAIRYATGFGGLTRVALTAQSTMQSILSADGIIAASYDGAVAGSTAAWSTYGIVADDIFADRNVLRLSRSNASTGNGRWNGIRIPINTWNPDTTTWPDDVVIGFTFTPRIPAGTLYPYRGFAIGAYDMAKSLTAATEWKPTDVNDCWVYLSAGYQAGDGTIQLKFMNAQSWTEDAETPNLPTLNNNETHHFELRVQRASNRIRCYCNGTLVKDITYAGTKSTDLTEGISMFLTTNYQAGTAMTGDIGNVYMLEVDAVHTDRLGSGARVIEYAPATDADVQYSRDETKFASNAAVASQSLDNAAPGTLTAQDAGTYDLYAAPANVTQNASKIYGMAVKFRAANFAGGDHYMAVKYNVSGGAAQLGTPSKLATSYLTLGGDTSVNPATGAVWTPGEISAATVGFQLTS